MGWVLNEQNLSCFSVVSVFCFFSVYSVVKKWEVGASLEPLDKRSLLFILQCNLAPSSNGSGHHSFKVKMGVRFPSELFINSGIKKNLSLTKCLKLFIVLVVLL